MPFQLKQVGRTFAAEATGIDLRQPIDEETRDDIEDALAQYGVVAFRGQQLNDDQQQAFIQMFGPPVVAKIKELVTSHPHFLDIGTVDAQGRPIEQGSAQGMYMLANSLWHTDGSQAQPPIRLTALHARELPSEPPPTEYADMRAAWEALSPERQAQLENLQAVHSIFWSREQIGMKAADFSEETRAEMKPVVHPLVRTNPRTGRKSLYLASHASHIVGMPLEEGRALIQELIAFATQPQFVFAYAWTPNDLVMWDDRWTMHRATPYDRPQPRKLRWCGVRELEPV
jgi:alpha-ketoglutarate-dependent 2,4-dichlorophenoxyacetate dioxygenase